MNGHQTFTVGYATLCWMIWCIGLRWCRTMETPVDTEVRLGESTYLNCSTTNSSGEINWYHYPIGSLTDDYKYVYAYRQMFPPYDKRFRVEVNKETGSFNLIINEVQWDDAGLFICKNGGDHGHWAQLIVLDPTPVCDSNIRPSGFIGKNDCGLRKDFIQLSCSMHYRSNVPPKLNWMNRLKNGTIVHLSDAVTRCRHDSNEFVCNVTSETSADVDGSQLVCLIKGSRHSKFYYISDTIRIDYAYGDTSRAEKQLGDDVFCSAHTNSESCHYKWVWFDGVDEETVSNVQHMNIKRHGWHRCEAECQLGETSCRFYVMLVKALDNTDHVPAIILTVFIASAFLLVLGVIGWWMFWILWKSTRPKDSINKENNGALLLER